MTRLLLILLATVACAGETNTLSDNQLMQQAIVLARAGLYTEAAAVCKEILGRTPDQPAAKQLLHEIEELRRKREAADPGYALRNKLEQIIVPEVIFREAAPADVVEYLKVEANKLSPDKMPIDFVWSVLADARLRPVTFNLRNVPLSDALGYVTQLAGLRYRVEARAVVIYKPEPERAIPPASEPLHVKPK
jgi:hypothetical protein